MTREPDKDAKPPGRTQSGGRGRGGPPANIPYGGQARSVYTPPARSSEPEEEPRGRTEGDASASAPKKMPASKSRYGNIAPGKPLVSSRAPIFGKKLMLQLQKTPDSDAEVEWPIYVSTEKVPGDAGISVVKGVYLHRSWLPDPPPEKLTVRFEPA